MQAATKIVKASELRPGNVLGISGHVIDRVEAARTTGYTRYVHSGRAVSYVSVYLVGREKPVEVCATNRYIVEI